MRLIDADELTKRYQQMMEYEHNYNAAPISWVAAFEEFIDSIENAQTVDCWISVKDRLPERKEYLHESNVIRGSSEYVLVYISATFPYKRMFVTIGRYSYDEMYPRWIVRSSHDGDVTHWMPLPEPPEEDKDDEL